jgi:alpha-beta hydrolase superfamily lysophospholipase
VSPAAQTDHFAAHGGLALLRRSWRGPRSTRVLAIVHGLAEHSERYDAVANWFIQRDFRVYAFDQRGHGESEGPRTHAPSFEVLLDDVERFLATIQREEPELPLVLLGHSMGGLEVATLLAERHPPVAAAILSGPALSVGGAPKGRLAFARLLSTVAPTFPIPRPVQPEHLSRDPAVVDAYVKDPRIPKRISARLATSLLEAAAVAADKAGQVEAPVLIVHGEADQLCLAEGSRRFHAGLRTAGSDVRFYPELRHEVLNEPEREQVMRDIHAWIEKQVPTS